MKTCTKCNTEKELTEFYGQLTRGTLRASCKSCDKQRRTEYYQANKETEQAKSRLYNANNPIEKRDRDLKYKYKIGYDDYATLWEQQKGVCSICSEPEQQHKTLAVDHCHSTGIVRGLLCSNCNTAIGKFKEDPKRLNNAIEYLKSTSA